METCDILVIGAGPAGLMAAETAARAGAAVVVADRMPSLARKLLMAGKSGLNITREEEPAAFRAAYACPRLAPMLDAMGPVEVMAWAEDLGQPLYTGSTGRVFPRAMKASPLLRAWLGRLDSLNVRLRTRWEWTGGTGFSTPDGPVTVTARATILALGGASWSRLGSDGRWASILAAAGLPIAPFAPANAGLRVAWSEHMAPHFGAPIKNAALIVGGRAHRGEFVISRRGLEGSGLYAVSKPLRAGAPLAIDLKPDLDEATISRRFARAKGSLPNRLRKALKLDPAATALLLEFARPLPADPAPRVKHLAVPHQGLRPLDEAISTAGGLSWEAVDGNLMLRSRPGTFACGEMLDWEAPTGGYLLTACLATGAWAGRAAARRLAGAP